MGAGALPLTCDSASVEAMVRVLPVFVVVVGGVDGGWAGDGKPTGFNAAKRLTMHGIFLPFLSLGLLDNRAK